MITLPAIFDPIMKIATENLYERSRTFENMFKTKTTPPKGFSIVGSDFFAPIGDSFAPLSHF